MDSVEIFSRSASETAAIGAVLGRWLEEGDVILLHGDLGAGKTTLAKGIAAALSVAAVVSSPSFALVNEYETGPGRRVSRLYHLDLYRLQRDDISSFGFADYTPPIEGATLIEWPERAVDLLPDRYLLVELVASGPEQRRIRLSISPEDDESVARFAALREQVRTGTD